MSHAIALALLLERATTFDGQFAGYPHTEEPDVDLILGVISEGAGDNFQDHVCTAFMMCAEAYCADPARTEEGRARLIEFFSAAMTNYFTCHFEEGDWELPEA
jgi:hypothetical protein